MSPALDRSLNRRGALVALGTLSATALGWHDLAGDATAAEDIPLERIDGRGIPAPTMQLLTAQLVATFGVSDEEWRQVLHDAARLSETYTKNELVAQFRDINTRSRAAVAAG